MSPPKKKRPLRTSEGRPEMRNPNQILAEAASRISGDPPKKGKKLELNSYFRSGEGHRMANRILKDNGVIPQHRHDRKDAEAVETLVTDLQRYNRKRQDLLPGYRDRLHVAREALDRYSKHVAATGRQMPVYPSDSPQDVDRRVADAESELSDPIA